MDHPPTGRVSSYAFMLWLHSLVISMYSPKCLMIIFLNVELIVISIGEAFFWCHMLLLKNK